tara:strand:+ start:7000 stop:7800 length:801 start_codon:yes stop_codon:yes gene_type:complete
MTVKKHLISFGSPNLKKSIKRFITQSKVLKYYDKVKVFSLSDLNKKEKDKLKKLLRNQKNKKGYGFWSWKPIVIKKYLKQIKNNDIINYVDLGCHLNPNGKKRLDFYIKKLNQSKNGMIGFQYKELKKLNDKIYKFQDLYEYKYTKSDLFEYFDILRKKKFTHTPQFWAGNIFLKKNNFTKNFINNWINVFEKRFDLIDDTKSKKKNFKNFIKHKSDQSVYSILCKIYKVKSLSAYECEWIYYKKRKYWKHTLKSPIIAKRDKVFM